MVYIGIDPSITNTGMAGIFDNNETIIYCNASEYAKNHKLDVDVVRFKAQAEGLVNKIKAYSPALCAYEDYSYNSIHRGYSLAEYGGILKCCLSSVGIFPLFVPPMQVKKFAAGTGSATKEMVANAMKKAFPEVEKFVPKKELTSDVTDALALAALAFYLYEPELAARRDKDKSLVRCRLELTNKIMEKKVHG